MSHEPTVREQLQDLVAGRALTSEDRARLAARLEAFDDETAAALDGLDAADLAVALARVRAAPTGRRSADHGAPPEFRPRPASSTAVEAKTQPAEVPSKVGLTAVSTEVPSKVGSTDAQQAPQVGSTVVPVSVRRVRARRWRAAVAVCAVAAAALALITLVPPSPDPSWTGIKGPSAIGEATLFARIGAYENGRPVAGQALANGAEVPVDAAVLFRYRLSAPGWVYLVADGDGGPQVLFAPGRQRAGAHEVASDGQALALRPSELGTTVQVTLWACPEATEEARLLTGGCPKGAHSGFLLRVERSQ